MIILSHQGVLGLWLCLLVLLQQTTSQVVDLQRQSNGKYGLVVPLGIRHGVHRVRGRSLLRNGMTPVLGAIREGYFYAKLGLGTPPKYYSTIIDTGSTITYIPCANCAHCGVHMEAPFDPKDSSTATVLGCQHQACECGTPACSCVQKQCYYKRSYAEMSSSEGWLIKDKLQFPDNGSSIDFVFGCENKETGAIYKQKADGVLGMGNNENSFPRQLVRNGLVDDVFSLCYGFPEGGTMLLGDVPLDPTVKLQYTPLIDRKLHYYNVGLQSMSLGDKSLGVSMTEYSKGYGTVLDSGTTFTYLPTAAFNAFVGLLNDALRGKGLHRSSGADPQFNDICWRNAPHDFNGLENIFPTGRITFAGGAAFTLPPQRYLFMVGRGEYCLGIFDNGWQGTLVGGIIVRNVLVQYDKNNSRVGFAEANCNELRSAPAATAPASETQASSQSTTASDPKPAGTQSGTESPSAPSAAGDSGSSSTADTEQQQQAAGSTAQGRPPDQQQQTREQQQQSQQQQTREQQQQSPALARIWGDSSSSSSRLSSRDWLVGFVAGAVVAAVAVQVVHTVRGVLSKAKGYTHVGEQAEAAIATELTPLAGPVLGSATRSNASQDNV